MEREIRTDVDPTVMKSPNMVRIIKAGIGYMAMKSSNLVESRQ